MEQLETKLNDNLVPSDGYLSDHCVDLIYTKNNDQTAFGVTVSSLSTKGGLHHRFQDFHHHHHHHLADDDHHQFYINNGSSSTSSINHHALMMSKQPPPPCFDAFDLYPYNCSSTNNLFDLYDCKPFAANTNDGGHGQVMDNFQVGGGRRGGIGCLTTPTAAIDRSLLFLNYHHQDVKPVASFAVPDEVSSVGGAGSGYYSNTGNNKSCASMSLSRKATCKGRKRSNVVKGQWTNDEDRLLIQLVEQFGLRKWSHIAQMLPGRIGKQCRERWHNHLRPDIKKDTWSEEEDKILIQAHSEIGNKWAEIAKRLPGRTENSIKNHWNATKRRQYSKRKCRSKYPRASLLQEYIKSLNLTESERFPRKSRGIAKTIIGNNNNDASSATTKPAAAASSQSHDHLQDHLGCCSSDRLVPDFEFGDVPELSFDENLFQEECTIEGLLDDMPCPPVPGAHGDQYEEYDMEMLDMDPLMESEEPKKDLDLMEMISQVNF